MAAADVRELPKPSKFFGAAWESVKRVPGMFALRFACDLFGTFFRFAVLAFLALPFVIHLTRHIDSGGGPFAWPAAVVEAATRPEAFVALAGIAFVGWLVLFATEAFASAGVWGAMSDVLAGRETSRFGTAVRSAFSRFADALPQRLLAAAADATLLAVAIGTCIAAHVSAIYLGRWLDSPLVVPAATWAVYLSLLACFLVLVRLTVELVAAPLFMDGVGLGEAIERAAATVVAHPVYIYRIVILALSILIGPLIVLQLTVLLHSLAIEFQTLQGPAALARLGGELLVLLGFTAFMVMLHSSFFIYYAWWTDSLDGDLRVDEPVADVDVPSLHDLLPAEYEHTVDVEDLLGPWRPEDTIESAPRPAPAPTPRRPAPQPDDRSGEGLFDLDAILRSPDEEE